MRCTQEALWLPLSSVHLVTWLSGRRRRPCSVQAWLGHPARVAGLGQVGRAGSTSHLRSGTPSPPQTELREAAAGAACACSQRPVSGPGRSQLCRCPLPTFEDPHKFSKSAGLANLQVLRTQGRKPSPPALCQRSPFIW